MAAPLSASPALIRPISDVHLSRLPTCLRQLHRLQALLRRGARSKFARVTGPQRWNRLSGFEAAIRQLPTTSPLLLPPPRPETRTPSVAALLRKPSPCPVRKTLSALHRHPNARHLQPRPFGETPASRCEHCGENCRPSICVICIPSCHCEVRSIVRGQALEWRKLWPSASDERRPSTAGSKSLAPGKIGTIEAHQNADRSFRIPAWH